MNIKNTYVAKLETFYSTIILRLFITDIHVKKD